MATLERRNALCLWTSCASACRVAARVLLCFGLASLPSAYAAQAQDDAYHEWIRTELETRYGLTGGTWLLGDSETQTLDPAVTDGVALTEETSPEDVPFTSHLRAVVTDATPDRPWERTLRWPSLAAASASDVLLVVFWIRGTAQEGAGLVGVRFEETGAPYTSGIEEQFEVGEDWQLVLIPFAAPIEHPVGEARLQTNLGFKEQDVEIGGVAVLNFADRYRAGDLPSRRPVVDYEGRDENAPWRAEAAARIEAHRKGDLTVRVVDAAGQPIVAAPVDVAMQRHAFGFGSFDQSAYLTGVDAGADRYREAFARLFNYATIGIYWSAYDAAVADAQLDWLEDQGLNVRAHPILWGNLNADGWSALPDDVLGSTDPAYVTRRVRERITDVTGDLDGRVTDYDVLNEPAHVRRLEDVVGDTARTSWFRLARTSDPDAGLFINDYGILSQGGVDTETRTAYKTIIQNLLDAGAPLDGIGFQAHMSSVPTAPARLYEILDEFASFGLDLKVTEFDMDGMDADLAADYLRDFITILYSHPLATSFTMWGFWDGRHWLDDAPLFYEDWTPKLALFAYEKLLFEDWWTDVEGTTGDDGLFQTRGFAGTYTVTTKVDGTSYQTTATLGPDGATVELGPGTATSTDGAAALPRRVTLQAIYPNPSLGTATAHFSLPQPSRARLDVFDVTGRRVARFDQGPLTAGSHEAPLDVQELPPGLYICRLEAGARTMHQPLIVVR